MDNYGPKELANLCDFVMQDKDFLPSQDITHCNEAVNTICSHYGYLAFEHKLANEIHDICFKTWKKISGFEANQSANNGSVCIAAQKAKPHGHVAIVYPGAMVWSTKWKKDCPVLANVGRRNGVMGANWAFETEPFYFVYAS